jgi:hypothetical protein
MDMAAPIADEVGTRHWQFENICLRIVSGNDSIFGRGPWLMCGDDGSTRARLWLSLCRSVVQQESA